MGEQCEVGHLCVFTLGYSRRLWTGAYPHERLSVRFDGHERAFRYFGGVPLEYLMITRAPWCWAALSTRCSGIRCSGILPAPNGFQWGDGRCRANWDGTG
jgi:hypothetical protein